MEKYPVKPGTAVLLPKHNAVAAPVKKNTRPVKQKKPEEIMVQQRKIIRTLLAIVACLILLLTLSAKALYRERYQEDDLPLGQNFRQAQTTTNTSGK